MKLLKYAIAFAFVALTARGEVSVVNLSTTANGSLTNVIPAATTASTQLGNGANLSQWKTVALQASFVLTTTNVGNLVLTFARSGSQLGSETSPTQATYETATTWTWTLANNGTTNVVGLTNLPATFIDGVSAIKLISAQNTASAGAVSNLNLLITRKR